MLNLVETRYLNQVLYQEWLPEVYLDTHQMGNRNARIFVPPFKNPPNPNVDPLIWSQVNQLGQAMASKLHEADKPGVIWGELYSGFWQGANNTNPWWHNMVGLLTEVASADLGTPVRQQRVSASRRLRLPRGESLGPRRGLGLPLAPPRDIQARMNYPRPWLGGLWTPADVVEYHALAMDGLLESVANNRTTLKRNFYAMNQRAIERFAGGSPYAFVIPAGQGDPAAAAKLVRLLQAEAAEVDVAEAPFVADGTVHPAGSYVVRARPALRAVGQGRAGAAALSRHTLAVSERADRQAVRRHGLVARHADGRRYGTGGAPVRGESAAAGRTRRDSTGAGCRQR